MLAALSAYQFLLGHIRQGELVELQDNCRLQGAVCALSLRALGYRVSAFEAQLEVASLWTRTQKVQIAALQLNPGSRDKEELFATNGGVGEQDIIRRALLSRPSRRRFEINRCARLGPWQDLLEMKFLNGTSQPLYSHAVPAWVEVATALLGAHELHQGIPALAALAMPRPRL